MEGDELQLPLALRPLLDPFTYVCLGYAMCENYSPLENYYNFYYIYIIFQHPVALRYIFIF
jgi:hypothetical protein